MTKPTALSVLTSVTQGGQASGLQTFVYTNPQLAADMARLQAPKTPPSFDKKGNRTFSRPNSSDLKQISAKVAQNDEDAQAVMQLFSDVKIAAEILISSIRSPNDMYEGEVLFELKDNLHCSPIASKLLPMVRSYFTDVYPLADKFEDVLRNTLFGAGSHPILVLPENSLTDIISGKSNVSTERLSRMEMATDGYPSGTGILGPSQNDAGPKTALERAQGYLTKTVNTGSRTLSVESSGHKISCDDVVILDNPLTMCMPLINQIARENAMQAARKRMGSGESNLSDRDLTTMLYRRSTSRQSDFVKIKTNNELTRYSVGRPLTLDLPPESVVPVINRGRPKDPIGFIIVLDGDGAPLSRLTETSQFEAMKKSKAGAAMGNGAYGDMSSYLLQRTATAFGGGSCEEITLRQVNQIFGEILEADFASRFRNGIMGSEVSISNSERLGELMLYRVNAQQKTQLLFVPSEMLTYYNYQVNDNGTGRNLLQDSLVISSMRAQVMFARVMAAIKNAVGRVRVEVEVDPDDPNSQSVFDQIKTEVLTARQTLTTPNSVNPTDVLNQIQASGIEFAVTGASGLPDTKVTFNEVSSNYQRADDELPKELADLMINHIGVPPEMVEEARRPDFATVAIANNVLFSKRVRHMQQRFDPQNTHLVISMLMADATFIIELKKVILENLDIIINHPKLHEDLVKIKENKSSLVDLLCSEFISNIVASLSRPDLKSIDNNLEAYNKHEELTDKALSNVFSSESIDGVLIGEETLGKLDSIKNGAKAAIMRRFMLENNMASEVFDLLHLDEDGILSFDLQTEITAHTETVAKIMKKQIEKLSRVAAASDAEQKALVPNDAAPGVGGADSFVSGTSDGSSEGDGGGDDMFSDGGMGDFDMPKF